MSKNNKKVNTDSIKKYTIVAFVVVGVLFIGITRLFRSGGEDEVVEEPVESGEELVIEDDRDKLIREKESSEGEENQEPENADEASLEKARSNLEKTDQTLEEAKEISDEELEQLNGDLDKLFVVFKEGAEFTGEGEFFLTQEFGRTVGGLTEAPMAQQLDTAINLVGYEPAMDSAEWYASETEDVYQFLITLKAEGFDDLVFSGNYNINDRKFKVAKMDGHLKLDDFAS